MFDKCVNIHIALNSFTLALSNLKFCLNFHFIKDQFFKINVW